MEAVEVELLVGRVRVVVGEREAEEQRLDAEDALEVVHDGDGTAFTHQHRLAAEGGAEGAERGLGARAIGPDEVGFACVTGFHGQLATRRTQRLQVRGDELLNFLLDFISAIIFSAGFFDAKAPNDL